MSKKISQDTFDDAVRENVEDFEMPQDDAVKDAVAQFRSQGVDLSNIDTSGGVGKEEVLALIETLILYKDDRTAIMEDTLLESLNKLTVLCSKKDNEYAMRNKYLMGNNKGLSTLYFLLDLEDILNETIIIAIFQLYIACIKSHIDNKDSFEPGGSRALCKVLKQYMMKHDSKEKYEELLILGLQLANNVAKCENNKVALMKNGVTEVILYLLNHIEPSVSITASTVIEKTCLLIRELCVHDDIRREMSCAVDNGKYFLNAENVANLLLKFSNNFVDFPNLASAALAAARNLITTEESVKIMAQNGAMSLPLAILSCSSASVILVRNLLGFTRNLCADDVRKERFITMGLLPPMIRVMSDEKYMVDSLAMEHAIACLAAMSLRNPANSYRIVEIGAIEIIVKIMHRFNDNSALLRQGCLCIRNIAARCTDIHDTLLDAGVESILRIAGKHQAAIDEAYGALRDLKCEVKYIKYSSDGTVSTNEFGNENVKMNFNPIYDADDDIVNRVQDEAVAPGSEI